MGEKMRKKLFLRLLRRRIFAYEKREGRHGGEEWKDLPYWKKLHFIIEAEKVYSVMKETEAALVRWQQRPRKED